MSNGAAMRALNYRQTHTHAQTHRTHSNTSTADAGGNNGPL